jgi:hypothetical protein
MLNYLFGWPLVGCLVGIFITFATTFLAFVNLRPYSRLIFTLSAALLTVKVALWLFQDQPFRSYSFWGQVIISFLVFGLIGGSWTACLKLVDVVGTNAMVQMGDPMYSKDDVRATLKALVESYKTDHPGASETEVAAEVSKLLRSRGIPWQVEPPRPQGRLTIKNSPMTGLVAGIYSESPNIAIDLDNSPASGGYYGIFIGDKNAPQS